MTSPLLRSPILWSGVLIWTFGLVLAAVVWVAAPEQAVAAGATLLAFLAAGKIVGITAGLTLGGHPVLVWLAVFLPDFGAVVFFHPLSQVGLDRLGRWSRFVGDALAKARERHHRGEGLVARHGAWGLFALALVPIGFYSPLVIAALGQVAGLRPRSVITAVGAAIAIMTTVWVGALNAGLDQAAAVDPRLPWIVGIGLTVVFVGKSLVVFLWRRTHPVAPPPAPRAVATADED